MELSSIEERMLACYERDDARGLLQVVSDTGFTHKHPNPAVERSKFISASPPTFCADRDKNINSQKRQRKAQKHLEWDPLFLWFRPSLCCIHSIGSFMEKVGMSYLSSIGCGSGLLEWLLWKLAGLDQVLCYEVNEEWWTSSYAPQRFMPHIYVDEQTIPPIPSDHALLFCYFNNGPIFRDYMENYRGNLVILIGSEDGSRKTDPSPLALIDSKEWTFASIHIQPTNDLVAFYIRKKHYSFPY